MTQQIGVDFVGNTASWDAACKGAADNLKATKTSMLESLRQVGAGFNDVGSEAKQTASSLAGTRSGYDQLQAAIKAVAASQLQANAEFKAAKAAYKAGEIDLAAYKTQILETRTALSLVRGEYSRSVANIKQFGKAANDAGGTNFGLRNLGFQLSDVATQFAGGAHAALIFAQQGPQVVQAVQEMSGGTSKFASFMSGPWGVALMVGTAVVGALATKLLDSGDAAKKAKDAHLDLSSAVDRQKASHEALTKAIDDYNQSQKKSTEDTRLYVAQAKEAAEADLKRALATRQLLKAQLEAQENKFGNAMAPQAFQAADIAARNSIADKQKANAEDIKRLQTEINNRALQLGEFAGKAIEPLEAIRQKYDDIRKVIRDTSQMGLFKGKPVEVVLRQVGAEQAAAEKAAREAAKSTNGSGAAQASVGDMVALIKQIFPGASVTSTTGGKHVSGSDHYAGRAIDFVPAGGMGQYTTAQVEQMLKDAGVSIRRNAKGVEQFFGPGRSASKPGDHDDHFHVAWTASASPEEAARRMAAAQEKAQRLADQQVRQAKEFVDIQAGLDGDLLAAKRANVTDAEQIAQFARDQVTAERDKLIADIEAKAALNPIIKAHKDELEEKVKQIAEQKLITINVAEARRKSDESLAIWTAANDNQKDILSLQEQLAVTQEDRRRLQLSILAIEKEEERRALQRIANDPQASAAAREDANIRLGSLDARYGFRQQGIMRGTESPLENYIRQNDPRLIGERVEGLMVDELEAVRTGINDAIANTLGVEDPMLRNLIGMFIDQVLIQPIARALQAHMGGGGGFFGQALSFIGGAMGGGNPLEGSLSTASSNVAGLAAGINSSGLSAFAMPMPFAEGGAVKGPGTSTSDSIQAWLSNGEYVLNAAAVRRWGKTHLDMMNKGVTPPRFAAGGIVGKYQDLAANNNALGTVHIGQIVLPNVTNAREAREAGRQVASAFQSRLAAAKKQGY
ncbi:phage tail length tape measure family protein [Sphingobium sp. CFD-2]|uniref:phage tail length tape measure family protein n=1 Tax=Sphingobium sp. CFD-2 TaxID=2878542 RepID=UPI00214A9355|nr:phage tail length tape measure family protein [Sphingobium sp. CFD-2]